MEDKEISKSNEKKLQKKLRRKILSLLKEFNTEIEISTNPTNHLFVGNSGMLCGYTRERLLTMFKPYGQVTELIMIPKKSFSFLSYSRIDSAKQAISMMNNYSPNKITGQPVVPLVMQYITKFPDVMKSIKYSSYPVSGKPEHIDGLLVINNFITEEEENDLIQHFRSSETEGCTGSMKHRSVKHFGYEFLYGSNNIDKNKPLKEKIPPICDDLFYRMKRQSIIDFTPDQLTVNQYEPGQGIPPHIDTHSAFVDGILSLSLKSQVTMEFTHPNGKMIPIVLPRRSLLVMREEARYLWKHGIIPRKSDIICIQENEIEQLTVKERDTRISLTFRKILHHPCICKYKRQCDSQKAGQDTEDAILIPTNSNEATNLESAHVHEVYEEIAEHFSGTRHSPWPRVKEFLCNLPNGSLVADIGCGNGKYLGVNPNIVCVGSDRSLNLANISKQRGFNVVVADCLEIPYRSNAFDVTICIAVIHHLSTDERRLHALKELVRITKINGLILTYVWALEQDKEKANNVEPENGKTEKSKKTEENDVEKLEETKLETKNENIGNKYKVSEQQTDDSLNGLNESETCSVNDKLNLGRRTDTLETMGSEIQVSAGRNIFQQQDLLVPWHLKGSSKGEISNDVKILHRFYHVFKTGELEQLCMKIENIEVMNLYFDKGNWCVVLKKISQDVI